MARPEIGGYPHAVHILAILLPLSCGAPPPVETVVAGCPDRVDDADCDGRPDDLDLCPDSAPGPTDASGCSDNQAAGCAVDGLNVALAGSGGPERTFTWEGDCDQWMLQFSPDADFLAGRTTTALRTTVHQAEAVPTGAWWRVVGGKDGSSRVASSTPQPLP